MSSNTAPSRQQDTNIKIPLISKIAYGMATSAAISAGCLSAIF